MIWLTSVLLPEVQGPGLGIRVSGSGLGFGRMSWPALLVGGDGDGFGFRENDNHLSLESDIPSMHEMIESDNHFMHNMRYHKDDSAHMIMIMCVSMKSYTRNESGSIHIITMMILVWLF